MREIILNLLDVGDQSFEDILVMSEGFTTGDVRNELELLLKSKFISYDKDEGLYAVIPQP